MNWRDRISQMMHGWGASETITFALGLSLALLFVIGMILFGAPAAQDAIESEPYYKAPGEDLAMGEDLPARGEGAAPSTVIPRYTSRNTEVIWKPVRCTDEACQWSPRGNNNIEAIVVHVATGRPDQCDGTANYLANNSLLVSAHFLVCDKKVYQQVEVGDAAHHAGLWGATVNPLANPLVDNWWRNRINPNVRTVGIETMLTTGYYIDNRPEMKENLIELLVWLVQQTDLPPDRIHIIGHFETDYTNRRTDPICCMDLNAITVEVANRVFAAKVALPAPGQPPVWNGSKWLFSDGIGYDPVTQFWLAPNGLVEWEPCNADRLRWNRIVLRWFAPGDPAGYDPINGNYWSRTPEC